MTVLRRTATICLLLAAIVVVGGCGGGSLEEGYQKYGFAGVKKIGVVLSAPGKAEPGLNEAVSSGIRQVSEALDADYKILAPGDLVSNEESLRYLAENSFDLVVAIGPGMTAELAKVAPDYPEIKFAIFNGEIQRPNVVSVRVNQEDGAFLAGVQAASLTHSNLVGYTADPLKTDASMETGFVRGVQYVNMTEGKKVKVGVSYTGVADKAAGVAAMGKAAADNLFWTGADVVFAATDQLASGVALSAEQNRKMAICTDLRVMQAAPWRVYGSVAKKPDTVAFNLAKQILLGSQKGGRVGYGLAEGGVDFMSSQAVGADILTKLAAIKEQLKKDLVKPYSIGIPQDLVIRVNQTQPNAGNQLGQQKSGQAPVQQGGGQATGQQGSGQSPIPSGDGTTTGAAN